MYLLSPINSLSFLLSSMLLYRHPGFNVNANVTISNLIPRCVIVNASEAITSNTAHPQESHTRPYRLPSDTKSSENVTQQLERRNEQLKIVVIASTSVMPFS